MVGAPLSLDSRTSSAVQMCFLEELMEEPQFNLN